MENGFNEIVNVLRDSRRPLKCDEVAKHFGLKASELRKTLNRWCEETPDKNEPLIAKIETEHNTYYTVNDGIRVGEIEHMAAYMGTYLAHMMDYFEETEKNARMAKKGIRGIYAEIISLMGIFVSVFSLIVINANIMTSLIDKDVCDIVGSCIIINGCTLVVITVLISLIHLVIVKPLNEQ